MRSRRFVTRLAVTASLLCLTACVPSKNPVSDPTTCTADEDLIGLWVSEERDTQQVLLIGRKYTGDLIGAPKGIMCMGNATFDKNGYLSSTEANKTFFVSPIGTEKFMNEFKLSEASKPYTAADKKVVNLWSPEGVKEYTLFKYRVTNDKLVIWSGDPARIALATLIDKGQLAGSVKWDDKKEFPEKVELTASTDSLSKFLRGGGSAQMFPDTVRLPGEKEDSSCKREYRRLKLPAK